MRITRLEPILLAIALLAACKDEASTVPSDLAKLESAAEDTFDSVLVNDFAKARTQAAPMSDAWASYRPRGERDRVPPAALQAISAAIDALPTVLATSGSIVDAARAANAVSAPMSQLFATYKPQVPATVLDLDYLGREVLVDALASDYTRAKTHVEQITVIWSTLRPTVIERGGMAAAADFDATVGSARSAIDGSRSADLEAAARLQLEVVDAIEDVFAAGDPAD
jgi:hypothetical protein